VNQQLWGYKVEKKTYLGVRKQRSLNITALYRRSPPSLFTNRFNIILNSTTDSINGFILHVLPPNSLYMSLLFLSVLHSQPVYFSPEPNLNEINLIDYGEESCLLADT
jgi:hypothetical protein